MTQTYAPFAAGAGASVGQDPYLDFLGPMLQGDGVNTTNFGGSTLQVYGNSSGMQVLMRAGSGMIRGVMYSNTADVTLTIATANTSPRIDRVVLRNDRAHAGGGEIYPFVITGAPGSSPVPPAITQNVGGIWDITLAQVAVGASVTGINPGDVSDERQYLPLKIPVIDSRYPATIPPADGSAGRVIYDKNPASTGLVVNDGTAWRSVLLNTTLTWTNLAFDTGWTTSTYGPQVARAGNVVEFRCDAQVTGGSGNPNLLLTPLAAQFRPSILRTFPVWNPTLNQWDAVTIDPAGVITLSLPTGDNLINAIYLAG